VASAGSSNVAVVSGLSVVATVPVGSSTSSALFDPAQGWVYLSETTANAVAILNGTTLQATVAVGTGPTALAYDARDRCVDVVNTGSASVSVLNGTVVAGTVATGAGPAAAAFDPSYGFVYVANAGAGTVSVLRGTSSIATLAVGLDPTTVTFDPATGYVVVANSNSSNLSVLANRSVVATLPSGGGARSSVYDAENGWTYIADSGANALAIVAPSAYSVTFSETGLPLGSYWSVDLGAASVRTLSTSVQFTVPYGTYSFSVHGPISYRPTVSVPSPVVLHHGGQYVAVSFAPLTPHTLTFRETGLPSGTHWCVTVNTTQCAIVPTIAFPGLYPLTYHYNVTPIAGYSVTATGNLTLGGSNLTKTVAFSVVRYSVAFHASGLPLGKSWRVTIGTRSISVASAKAITFHLPNGTYAYAVHPIAGFTALYSGSVSVAGANVSTSVVFTRVTYPVTFTESGLPAGTNWSVTIGHVVEYSTGTTITFQEPNGTYTYHLGTVAGYTPSARPGRAVVHGSGPTVTVLFRPAAAHAVPSSTVVAPAPTTALRNRLR
jgi:hypothetical protein